MKIHRHFAGYMTKMAAMPSTAQFVSDLDGNPRQVFSRRGSSDCSFTYLWYQLIEHHLSVISVIKKSNKNSAEVDIAPAFGEITTACFFCFCFDCGLTSR